MKQIILSGIIGIIFAAQAGCGGNDEMDEQDLLNVMTMAMSMGVKAEGNAVSNGGEVDTSRDCFDGGNFDIMGVIYESGRMTDLNLTLNACNEDGITMDGMLHIVSSYETSASTTTVKGEVTASGNIIPSGDIISIENCVIDFTYELRVSEEVISTLKGTICGNAVDLEYGPDGPR